jgi:hypothetical protein
MQSQNVNPQVRGARNRIGYVARPFWFNAGVIAVRAVQESTASEVLPRHQGIIQPLANISWIT